MGQPYRMGDFMRRRWWTNLWPGLEYWLVSLHASTGAPRLIMIMRLAHTLSRIGCCCCCGDILLLLLLLLLCDTFRLGRWTLCPSHSHTHTHIHPPNMYAGRTEKVRDGTKPPGPVRDQCAFCSADPSRMKLKQTFQLQRNMKAHPPNLHGCCRAHHGKFAPIRCARSEKVAHGGKNWTNMDRICQAACSGKILPAWIENSRFAYRWNKLWL